MLSSPTGPSECPGVVNSARVSSSNADSDGSGPVLVTINCPDVGITKTTDTPVVNAGETIHYLIRVTNSGPAPACGVTVIDASPTGGGP